MQEGDTYFVWARNARGRLQKQTVAVQRYDEAMDEYEITSGLTLEDYIAWPDENCVPGAKATTELVWDEEGMDEEFYGSMDEEFYEELPGDGEVFEEPSDEEGVDTETDGEPAAEPAG